MFGIFQGFLKEIKDRMETSLAPYAVPLFIRLCSCVDKTGNAIA